MFFVHCKRSLTLVLPLNSYAVPRACLEVITRAQAVKLAQKNPSLRSAFERATLWLDRQELPASWGIDIDTLLGPNWRGAGTHAVLIFYNLLRCLWRCSYRPSSDYII